MTDQPIELFEWGGFLWTREEYEAIQRDGLQVREVTDPTERADLEEMIQHATPVALETP